MSALLSAEVTKLFVFEHVFLHRPVPSMEFKALTGARVDKPVIGLPAFSTALAAREDLLEGHPSLLDIERWHRRSADNERARTLLPAHVALHFDRLQLNKLLWR